MDPDSPRRRGRPSGPTGNALGEYLRRLRAGRGMTVRELARALGLPSTSAAYISQLESGTKVPSPQHAMDLTRVLGDKLGVFFLWSQIGRRSDPARAAAARSELARLLDDPTLAHGAHFMSPVLARFEHAKDAMRARVHKSFGLPAPAKPRWRALESLAADDPAAHAAQEQTETLMQQSAAREAGLRRERDETHGVRIPLLPEGTEPGGLDRAAFERNAIVRGRYVEIAREVLRAERAVDPFAWRLSEAGVRRVAGILRAGDVVVITRETAPHVVPHEIYAVRLHGEVVLALLMWNGRELLVLPGGRSDDFAVLPAAGPGALAGHVVGHVATVVRGADADLEE